MATASGGTDHNPNRGSRFRGLDDIHQFPENKTKKKRHNNDLVDPKTGFKVAEKMFGEYYILERIDSESDFEKVSPFFVEKALTSSVGANHETKLLRNGTLLVKCKNDKQAAQLLKLNNTLFGNTYKVKVTEHSSLNTVQGLIYCKASRFLSEEEILEGLQEQKVVAVRKIKRKVGDNLVDTNLCILTFKLSILPPDIKFGHYHVLVETYIPSPLRCLNCFRFGHTRKHCKNDRICALCSNQFHESACLTGSRCINCKGIHSNWSKECPYYKREVSIQTIKVQQKISYYEAKKKFDSLGNTANTSYAHTQNSNTYSQTLSTEHARPSAHTQMPSTSAVRTRTNSNDKPLTLSHTPIQSYADAITPTHINQTEKDKNPPTQSQTEIANTSKINSTHSYFNLNTVLPDQPFNFTLLTPSSATNTINNHTQLPIHNTIDTFKIPSDTPKTQTTNSITNINLSSKTKTSKPLSLTLSKKETKKKSEDDSFSDAGVSS